MKLHIIGADLSKKTVDFVTHPQANHLKIENGAPGFRNLMDWMHKKSMDKSSVMIIMEHTGLYSYRLEQFLSQNQIKFAKVSPLAIKRSMGLVRGKSDKTDAGRIAQYGYEKQDRLIADQPLDNNLQRLQMLHSTRERLVKNRAAFITAVKEYQQAYDLKKTDIIIASQLKLIKTLDQQIKKLEDEAQVIIEDDKAIKNNYQLLQSIKGVGKVLALATIIKTANFNRFTNARKFACYCGTAPFENTSGTILKGKSKISSLRDKRMKTLLDLAAKSAIQHDKELKEYYLNRTENGKSKKSTINVVRNKLLYRMFAIIKRQTPYQENYIAA